VNDNIKLIDKHIILPKIGAVKLKLHRQIPENYKLKSATISKTPSGKYYASILFEYEHIVESAEIKNAVGLDFSMAELYVDSNGDEAQYNRYYRRSLDKLKKMSRTLSKMKKFSNNWYKQKHKIAILHEKIANQRKDFLHKQSRQIANAYDLVGVEDLNMKAMSQALKFGKSVADNSFGMFRTLLKYKLEEQGKYFVTIDKWFPSSKLCNKCGFKNDDLTLSVREWICPECQANHDRDVNAAINIRNEAVRLVTA
jgi:putative transposase